MQLLRGIQYNTAGTHPEPSKDFMEKAIIVVLQRTCILHEHKRKDDEVPGLAGQRVVDFAFEALSYVGRSKPNSVLCSQQTQVDKLL